MIKAEKSSFSNPTLNSFSPMEPFVQVSHRNEAALSPLDAPVTVLSQAAMKYYAAFCRRIAVPVSFQS
jgi:hypothetical protein